VGQRAWGMGQREGKMAPIDFASLETRQGDGLVDKNQTLRPGTLCNLRVLLV